MEGGLGYVCYNKRCQAGVRTGSHAFLYLSVSNARRGFQRHGGLHPITPECRPLYSFTLQSEDKNHKYTCEGTAFCRRQRTNCAFSRRVPEDCWFVRHCIIKVWPNDQHKKDRSYVPTELYNGHGGGHQCGWYHIKACARIHISRQHNIKAWSFWSRATKGNVKG